MAIEIGESLSRRSFKRIILSTAPMILKVHLMNHLTHCDLMTPYGVKNLGNEPWIYTTQHWNTVLTTKIYVFLTHWDRVMHICVSRLNIIGSDNGLSPDRHQVIIWTNAWILLNGPLGTNFSEIVIEIDKFSFKNMYLKMSSAKWRQFCLGLNVLKACLTTDKF